MQNVHLCGCLIYSLDTCNSRLNPTLPPSLIEFLRNYSLEWGLERYATVCPNKDTIVATLHKHPSSSQLVHREGTAVSPVSLCMEVVGGNSSPANEILFHVRNLHLGQTTLHPPFSYWASSVCARKEGGPLALKKTILASPPLTFCPRHQHRSHHNTVNQHNTL